MKKLISILTICVLFTACSSGNLQLDVSTSVTAGVTSITETTLNSTADSETSKTAGDSNTVSSETSNDPSIIKLGEQKKLEFQKLYQDFLSYSFSELAFEYPHSSFKYEDEWYYAVESTEFTSVNDLYNYFLNFCTPEYSTELLINSRNYYRDIDGKLCLMERFQTNGTISFAGSRIDSYEIEGDYIIFNCTGLSDDTFALDYTPDNPVHHPECDIAITFTLKNIDENWFIDSCSNIDIFLM